MLQPSAPAAAKSLQSCPTLCDPIDGSPPGSPFPGILHARILEWVAISFSNIDLPLILTGLWIQLFNLVSLPLPQSTAFNCMVQVGLSLIPFQPANTAEGKRKIEECPFIPRNWQMSHLHAFYCPEFSQVPTSNPKKGKYCLCSRWLCF